MKFGNIYKAPSMPIKEKPKKTQEEMAEALVGDTKERLKAHKI